MRCRQLPVSIQISPKGAVDSKTPSSPEGDESEAGGWRCESAETLFDNRISRRSRDDDLFVESQLICDFRHYLQDRC
jgi:hypothetical protein